MLLFLLHLCIQRSSTVLQAACQFRPLIGIDVSWALFYYWQSQIKKRSLYPAVDRCSWRNIDDQLWRVIESSVDLRQQLTLAIKIINDDLTVINYTTRPSNWLIDNIVASQNVPELRVARQPLIELCFVRYKKFFLKFRPSHGLKVQKA